MRRYIYTISLFILTLSLSAQEAGTIQDELKAKAAADSALDIYLVNEEINSQFEQNFDSLLNVFYINQALESMVDDADFGVRDSLLPDFSDSVYIDRLAAIPSVIDLSYNRLVKNYINVYTKKRRDQVRTMLGLSEYYFPMIEEVFSFYDVPYELKYLAIIESALNPRAVSRAGAVGTWQFMYGTAKMYDLRINSLVDERRDPMKATHSAAKFLKNLYGIYGDWTLALAAYNCGPGNVNKAIRRSGGKKDFWEIYYYLPRETRGYVPAFIAATYTFNYHEDHYLSKSAVEIDLHTDTIVLNDNLHLKQVAEVMDIPVKKLRDLNPQYRYDIIPATKKSAYSLTIPVELVGDYLELQDSILAYKDSVFFNKDKVNVTPTRVNSNYRATLPSDKYDKLYYTVKSGDAVGLIADWYDVRTSDLRYWNGISRNMIRSGQKLVIYKAKGKSAKYKGLNTMTYAQKQKFAGRATPTASSATTASSSAMAANDLGSNFKYYTVKSGDTLWKIAQKYPGISDSDISRWNNLSNSNKIKPGQKIKIKVL